MDKIKRFYDKKVFLTAFLATFIIHGERIFNAFSWHDDATYLLKGWNKGLRHGRWLHHLMATGVEYISGNEGLPVISGIIAALCIALMACLLFELFKIKDYWVQLPLILIFCAIPSVAGHLGYMVSVGYDFIGKLICVFAAYILCKGIGGKKSVLIFLTASLSFAFALGEYQCHVAFYLTVLLCYFSLEILHTRHTWKEFFCKAFYYVGSAVVGLVEYLLILKIFLIKTGTELTSYAGTDSFGIVSISEYVERVIFAYKDFMNPKLDAAYNMFPFHWNGWHDGLLHILFGLMLLILLLKIVKRDYKGTIQNMIAFVLLPLGLNFNFVVYGRDAMHSLHVYHYILVFTYLFVLTRAVVAHLEEISLSDRIKQIVKKGIYGIVVVFVFIIGALYIRYDNFCYLQTELRQEKAISYYTTLVARIQSVEDYDKNYPIAFINAEQKFNEADEIDSRFDMIVTNPYNAEMVNSYNWDDFMKLWVGFDPSFAKSEDFEDNEIVRDMPSYPDDGSIQVIDSVVVVKF